MKLPTIAQRWARERNLGIGRIGGMSAQLRNMTRAKFLTETERDQCFAAHHILHRLLNKSKDEAELSKILYCTPPDDISQGVLDDYYESKKELER
jgi:hypothetical protein